MHDLLQQMCWKILCMKSDRKSIAIKSHEDIVDVLSYNPKGTQTVEVINQEPYKGEVYDHFIDPMCFLKMRKLKFVRISNVHFPQGLNYLPNDLRILEWYGCSLKSLPSTFEPKHIYELEMCCSQLKTLWKKHLELPNLRSINLSFSKDLTDIPNLTSASNLVKLNLEGCTNLASLHKSVLLHKRLRYLNLKGCTCLESLGRSHMEMEALEALLLSGCSQLENIPEFGKNMKRLEHLYVDGTRIKKLPENLGELCNLRNLDASRTSIEELPISIHLLQKLRLLHVNSCLLSFKTGCFLNPYFNTIFLGLKEVDLSYCNLSVVPDGIGLLCHLRTLDLSGNEFVSLPASIGLLSKLRMLSLNDCKRLQSLPKLSLVDEDMDYGPRSRFNYHVSAKEVDVSKFNALSFNNRPTVLCLNCPKLAADKRGSSLVEKILNSYLELRTKYLMTPEAVFEIVGAGSNIPSGFEDPGSEGLPLEDSLIGVAICAVISPRHVDGYMEANNMVTAHICFGKKYSKIHIPINFLGAGSETQIALYWKIVDDPQRTTGSSHRGSFYVSFDVEPDSNLQVTKVGVRFICEEYIMCLKLSHEESKIRVGEGIEKYINFTYEPYADACKHDTNLQNHTLKIVNFIFLYGSQQSSLVGIYGITKGLLVINQEFLRILNVYERVWGDETYVYCYYVIVLGLSVLYKDFIRSLKVINDGWLSVKLALEQIVAKSRADKNSYKEILEHLNDLQAAHSVGFSDNFISMFLSVCRRAFDFLYSITMQLSDKPQEETSRIMRLQNVLRRMLPADVLWRMLRETVLWRMLPANILWRMLQVTVLWRMLLENILWVMLPANILRRMLRVTVLWRMLLENISWRILREAVLLRIFPADVLRRMLGEKLAKISSIPIAGVICMMAVFMGDLEYLKQIKDVTLSSVWQHLFKAFTAMKDNFTEDGWFMMKTHYNYQLQILEFSNNGLFLQQLTNEMGRSDCFTEENKEEMMRVIDKLQINIHKVSSTIQDMSNLADQCCHDIEKARKHVKSFSQLSKDDIIISMLPLFDKN